MKHIKFFEQKALYESYISNSPKLPNVSYTVDTNQVFYNLFIIDTPQVYEWVDLGLPSGLKWADRNIGAIKPEDYGLYFAWGETEGYNGITADKQFSWEDYKWCNGSNTTLIKYNTNSSYGTVDNLTNLEQVDDAAYASDNTYRMPTKSDLQELIDNTTFTWETLNGVNGGRFTGTNGNSIFIPAAGFCSWGEVEDAGSWVFLWSSSLYDSWNGWNLHFDSCEDYDSGGMFINPGDRSSGNSVRAVKE